MKTPVRTLINRCRYKGGRKYRSAFRKLGKFRLREIWAAGCEIVITYPNGEVVQ